MTPEERVNNLYSSEEWDNATDLPRARVSRFALLVDTVRKAQAEAFEEAASIAFEKIRCDDRTDRWQVANEVAAHIRARKREILGGKEG